MLMILQIAHIIYNRRIETKNILEYIHGGLSGALCGAWDFILGYGDETLIEKFIASYRRGKFIETLYGKFSAKHFHSEDSMDCQSFDADTQEWRKHSITYDDYNFNLKTASVSNKSVELFVRSLDIGDVSIIPRISGVSRTITGLTTLIIDINLKVNNLRENLICGSTVISIILLCNFLTLVLLSLKMGQ